MKKIVFTFGRMNPPTIGHAKLVDKVQSVAKSEKADARVYLSHTSVQDDPKNKKDPLNYKQKIKYAKKAFGSIVKQSNSKTVFQIMSEMEKDGYTDVIMVVGSDRVPEFKKLLDKYNGKDYDFDSISVVSAGERDPDATGVEGMSASKLRALAVDGDFDTFKKGLPKGLNDRDAKEIFDTINKFIKESIEEQRAPLTIAQRQKMARTMKRLAPKLARFRKMKAKRMADRDQILKRAQKAARNVIRKKVAGERGADYSALSASEKITIDKLVMKKSAIIKKLAKKLLPKVRKAEMERLKKARGGGSDQNESFDALFEEAFLIEKEEAPKKTPQDRDVKDIEGTQPKKYYKGLSKDDKEARAKQFAKGADKPDDSPSSYKPAPGDDEAETKPSKHTLKYKKMFGEGEATQRAKDAIRREKESDKVKHDRMLDQARTQDTRTKNAQTKPQTEEYELSEDASASLKKKSEKSGIPVGILRQVYNRGMAAWKTGHRPGATQQQWGFARVNSFITKGKGTWGGADSDLAAKVRGKNEEVELDEKCWDGYKQVGMKKKGDKMVPDCVPEAVSPAQQAAIAISKKERGEKPKNEQDFKPHMMYDPETGESELAKVPADHERLSKQGWTHEKPKKNLKAMLGVPNARPVVPMGEEALEEMPRWLLEPLSKVTHKKGYTMAKKVLADVLARKKKEGGKKGLQHSIEYYAAQIAKQFDGVDARVLADMMNEAPEKMDAPQIGTDAIRKRYSDMTPGQIDESFQTPKSAGTGHTMFATEFMKIQGAYEHHPDVEEELERRAMEEEYLGWDDELVEETEYQGRKVKLNDPFRTPKGPKKFSVYVKNDKGNVVKVNFGDPNMEIKRDDPKRRKAFRDRHDCANKTDKTSAGYWSCRMWAKGQTVSDLD